MFVKVKNVIATIRLNLLRTISLLICLVAIATLVHPTFAKEASSPAAARKEGVASKAAVLKIRLDAFKDKRKAQIAERVNTNLNKINQKQTDQMKKHLDLMTSLLDKLETRVNEEEVKTAIAPARATIATASATVVAQSQKDYTITVSSESKIRTDAQAMKNQLKTDLQAVRKGVIDAKRSVSNAVRIAKSDKSKEGTNSGQQ